MPDAVDCILLSTQSEGKGSHGKIYVGDRVTTVPHGNIGVGLLRQ